MACWNINHGEFQRLYQLSLDRACNDFGLGQEQLEALPWNWKMSLRMTSRQQAR